MKTKKNIKDRIDNDSSLSKKGTWLMASSLILLTIQFSGAKVEEVNTFVFTWLAGWQFLVFALTIFFNN